MSPTLNGLMAALKAVKEISAAYSDVRLNAAVSEAYSKILDYQQMAYELQSKNQDLEMENKKLKARLSEALSQVQVQDRIADYR